MKVTFWLLDVNYEVKDHNPEVWLWGIDEDGRRILLVDRRFRPYFYLVLKEGANSEAVEGDIYRMRQDLPQILSFEPANMKFFGKPAKTIRVTCSDPDLLARYANKLGKLTGVEASLEGDIRFSMRYLIDNGITPCGWHEVEAEEAVNDSRKQVEKVYFVDSPPRPVERSQPPSLRVLGFTLTPYGRMGTPKPDNDPVVVISAATNAGDEVQFTAEGENDAPLMGKFSEFVRGFDPDIIVGYGSNQSHWPYLVARAGKHGLRMSVDRAGGEPHTSVYGHVSVTGRANIDLYDFADEFQDVKVKTLENIADFLGVMRLADRTIVEDVDVPSYWQERDRRPILLKFSRENLRSIMGVADATLDFAFQLSSLVGLPVDHIGTAAAGFRVDWFLIRHAHGVGELIPGRREQPYFPYEGGLVLTPKPGMHENVAALDFKSMYPNIMIAKNVSPDTYVPPQEDVQPSRVNVAPEVGHRFRKEPPGFYKEVLTRLIGTRDEVRKRLRALEPGSFEYRLLDARQRAIKVITNATYGYAGWLGARWYLKPVAEATAAWGRETIRNTMEMARQIGLEVIYGDTDSIFIVYDPAKVEALSKKVQEEIGLEMKPDKIYTRILFTEAKKRYCGLLPDGRLDIVGLEVIRGDWANAAKGVQETVLGILLRERSPEKAAEFVRGYVTGLLGRKVPYHDLIIWKTLTKPIDEYKVKAAHVEAAKMLKERGWGLTIGDKVGFVITKGGGKLYERAKSYNFASYDDIDLDYYVENQVKPAALRILEQFGITENDLVPS